MRSFPILYQINKFSLYLIIFLLPLFFLPFSQDVLGFPKQFLFLFLVFLGGICWFGRQIIQGKVILRENKVIYLFLFLIFVLFALSTIFSIWPKVSFWGQPLKITDSLLAFILFLFLVFLFVNTLENEKELFFAVFLFLLSAALAGVFLLLQVYKIFILPFDFAKTASFNTLGTIYQGILFLASLLPLSVVLAFRTRKPLFWLFLLILLVCVVLIDFNDAWIVLLPGILILSIFGLVESQEKIRGGWIGFLMFLLVLSIFFLFFPLRFQGFPTLPLQASPSFISELEILRGVYKESVKNIFLGTGPGTFIFDYSQYRSPLLNQTLFWGTRFFTGNSEFLDWFVTKGFLVIVSLLFLLIYLLYLGFKKITEDKSLFGMKLGLLASFVSLIFAGFLSPFNLTLWFGFWMVFSGLLFYNSRPREIDLITPFRKGVFSTLFVMLIIFFSVFILFQGKFYLADSNYVQGLKFSRQGEIDQAINSLQKAVLFNRGFDLYWRDLAQLYFSKANSVAQQELNSEIKRQLVQRNIGEATNALNQSIALAPFNVANWNVRGFLYRNLIGIGKAGEIALDSYRQAAKLEPASPFPYGEMGRVYILMAQNFRERQMTKEEKESLSLAVENLKKAIELKPDYAPAHYLIAVAYDQQGKSEEAIDKLEQTKMITPQNIGVRFQLGMLYWRKERLNLAQREFEQIIKLDPNYSNARYMLGLVYDKKGEKEKAKRQFEKVALLNPENEEVKKILENLEKGLPALEGMLPLQPPTEEAPSEIQM